MFLAFIAWQVGGAAQAGDVRRTPVVAAVEKVAPAVVNIATQQLVARRENPGEGIDPAFEEFFRDFAEPRFEERYEQASLGSGVIIDAQGHVLTNEHVVSRASRITVVLADKREFAARVVGTDASSDLAVLKITTDERLPFVGLGTSSDLRIGETVIAIGNPFGLSHSVTVGVLSAQSRTVRAGKRVFGDFLQTDASINPGNSGGPILNLDGDIIGIATAIYVSGNGIGFAIPVDRAKRVVEGLVSHGTAQPVWIGLETQALSADHARSLGLDPGRGLVVTHVVEGGPAADAKLRRGDILLLVGGEPVGTRAELDARLAMADPRSSIRLELQRDGRVVRASAKALQADSPKVLAVAEAVLGVRLDPEPIEGMGLRVREVAQGGRAAARGFAEGDILFEMDGLSLRSLEDFRQAFYRALGKRSVVLLVQHGEAAYYVPLPLD